MKLEFEGDGFLIFDLITIVFCSPLFGCKLPPPLFPYGSPPPNKIKEIIIRFHLFTFS